MHCVVQPESQQTAAAATPPPPAAASLARPKREEKKKKKLKKDTSEPSKRKKQQAVADAEPAEPGAELDSLLVALRQAAAALQQTEQHDGAVANAEDIQAELEALASCAAQLHDALRAAGSTAPPALQLLQAQLAQVAGAGRHGAASPAVQPAALALQADAAAAAAEQWRLERRQAQQAEALGLRERWRLHYALAFADCFAEEVEALQDAEPPIPAGVLLQYVRLAADSEAMSPAAHRALVLDAAATAEA